MSVFLGVQDFARIACLDGRLYGVIHKCDSCEITLNECIRNHLETALLSNLAIVERHLGYNVSPRYHEEVHTWDGKSLIQTNWPGVEIINVKQQIVDIEDFGPFPISPYVQENLVLTDSGDGYCIAEVSQDFIENPNHLIIRNTAGVAYETTIVDGYPRRDGNNWLIALVNRPTAPACDDILHAQSCKYMYLDVDDVVCENDGVLTPFYPGTEIEIPQIKPSEVIVGDIRRFWFAPWVLVDPAFYGEEVNLELGEFYKLLPEIDFKCVEEIEALPIVYAVNETNCNEDFDEFSNLATADTRLDLLYSHYGIVQMEIKNDTFCHDNKAPYKVKIFYKTNPAEFDVDQFLETIREAVVYLTAAELPLSICECAIKTGFIATAQKAYTEVRINPITGESVVNLKHGNLYGQLVYAEKLLKVPIHQHLIRL